jgi:putative membrane protein
MHEANAVDRLFVQLLTQGGLAEVEAGTTAASQSRADRIRSFGQWMREAHRAAQDKLDPLARAAGIPVPNAPSDDQKAQLAQLRSTDDAAFDIAYLQQQLVAHQQTANLLMWEIDNGQEPALTSYAADTLREVTHHLATVQLLMSEFAYVAPQGLGATMPVREAAQGRPGG